MIADAHWAVFAFRDMPAIMADDASRIAFFVDEDSYPFSVLEIFFYAVKRQLRKIRSDFLGHINQKNRLFDSLYVVIETFVIHNAGFQEMKQMSREDRFRYIVFYKLVYKVQSKIYQKNSWISFTSGLYSLIVLTFCLNSLDHGIHFTYWNKCFLNSTIVFSR